MFNDAYLRIQKKHLNQKIEREQLLVAALPKLSLNILQLAKSQGKITIREVVQLTGANRNTVKSI